MGETNKQRLFQIAENALQTQGYEMLEFILVRGQGRPFVCYTHLQCSQMVNNPALHDKYCPCKPNQFSQDEIEAIAMKCRGH